MTRLILLVVLGALAITACGKKEEAVPAIEVTVPATAEAVPASSEAVPAPAEAAK